MTLLNFLYNPITITIMMGISIIFALISLVYSFIRKGPSLKNFHRKRTIIDTHMIYENEMVDKSEKSEEEQTRDYYERILREYSKIAITNQLKGGTIKGVKIQNIKGIRIKPTKSGKINAIHHNQRIKLHSVKTNKRFHVISENNGE